MTGISAATDVGTLASVLYNTSLTSQSIATLGAQASSGLIAPDYAGLGNAAAGALDMAGQIALNTAYQANATQAGTQAQVAQAALGQIQSLTTGFATQLLEPAAGTPGGLSTLAATAGATLRQVANLLNTKVGDVYVFAGQDSRTPPVPAADAIGSSAFAAAVQAALGNLTTAGAAATQAQVLAAAGPGATSPFAPTLEASNQPSSAIIDEGQSVRTSVLADQNSVAVMTGVGSTSTGSYTRDILAGLATVAGLGAANGSDPQVQALLGLTQSTLSHASDALNVDIGGLGASQHTILGAQAELSATASALTQQLGALQDSDPAAVATKLAAAQTQLQASYKIIAGFEQLSLAKFL